MGLPICPATITREVRVGGGGNGRDGRGATGLISALQQLWPIWSTRGTQARRELANDHRERWLSLSLDSLATRTYPAMSRFVENYFTPGLGNSWRCTLCLSTFI